MYRWTSRRIYNFPPQGGGGGAVATLDGATVELNCVDVFDEIYLSTDYTADVTQLGTSANLSYTRFGGVSGSAWTQFTTLGATDDTFFNSGAGSTGAATPPTTTFGMRFGTILDPVADGPVSDPGYDGTSFVEEAATWYMDRDTNANLAALNSFLSNFKVVSLPLDDVFQRIGNWRVPGADSGPLRSRAPWRGC